MKIFKIIAIAILAIMAAIYIAYPIALGFYALKRYPASVGQPPNGFKILTLTTADNTKLASWYAPPQNGAVIILIHGGSGNRRGIRAYAEMLADNGFGVFAFDLRGHGESGGTGNAFAWNAAEDIGEAIAYLKKQEGVEAIGGLGTSLGGEVLLSSISTHPDLMAVVSDGATHRSIEDYIVEPSYNSFLGSFVQRIMYGTVSLFRRDAKPVTMLDSIKKAEKTPLLLVAAGGVGDEIKYNTIFNEAAVDRSTLWIIPNVGHVSGFMSYPREYEEKVISFFKQNLLNN